MTGIEHTSAAPAVNGTRTRDERASPSVVPPASMKPATTDAEPVMMPPPPPSSTGLHPPNHNPLSREGSAQAPSTLVAPANPSAAASVELTALEAASASRIEYVSILAPEGDRVGPFNYVFEVPKKKTHMLEMFEVHVSQLPVTLVVRLLPSKNGVNSLFTVRANERPLKLKTRATERLDGTVEFRFEVPLQPDLNEFMVSTAVVRNGVKLMIQEMIFLINVLRYID